MTRLKRVKRDLDFSCLESGQYGVIASIAIEGPGHPALLQSALQRILQAKADLIKIRPSISDGIVVMDCPSTMVLKLVVPAIRQGALLETTRSVSAESTQSHDAAEVVPDGSQVPPYDSGHRMVTIDATAYAEAEHLAEAAARISMAAVDVGTRVAARAEQHPITLDDAAVEFALSPDETVSRRTYSRSRGPAQNVQYRVGERVLGGGQRASSELNSADTFFLRRCNIRTSFRDGNLLVSGSHDDPEWNRLAASFPGCTAIGCGEESAEMQLLRLAQASDLPVDVDVCVKEKAATKRRRLVPVSIRNRLEIIASLRDRLELLEEVSR